MLKGVIFDVDGTLVDSNDAHAQSWVDAFMESGYDVPFEKVRPLIGMGAEKLLPKAIRISRDSDEGKGGNAEMTALWLLQEISISVDSTVTQANAR